MSRAFLRRGSGRAKFHPSSRDAPPTCYARGPPFRWNACCIVAMGGNNARGRLRTALRSAARWLRRVEDGFGDLPLVFDREVHNSGLLNDAASGFIGRGHHKVREAGPALAYPEYNAVRSKPGTAAALRGRRRSSNCQATANYLIGPSAENLLRPAPGGSSRSTCALPPLYRRLRTRIRCWPESGTSRASTIAALAGSVCLLRRTACSCLDSSCDP